MNDREYIIQLITAADAEEINLLAEYLRSNEKELIKESSFFNESFD